MPSGAPISADWRVEVVDADLPQDADSLMLELVADGGAYSGAARLSSDERGESGGTILVGNGPLLASEIETHAAPSV